MKFAIFLTLTKVELCIFVLFCLFEICLVTFVCAIVLALGAEIACDAQDAVCLVVWCGARNMPTAENTNQPHTSEDRLDSGRHGRSLRNYQYLLAARLPQNSH